MNPNNTVPTKNELAKARKRARYAMASPEGIEVTLAKPRIKILEKTGVQRIAIYVRVSTDNASQTTSFEIQQKYYVDMVNRNEGWVLVKIYADEAVSGTTTDHRDAFLQMIEDCEAGMIDLVITKNVSRFSRNILDNIGYVRRLAALKPSIGVYFESEGFCTLDDDSELKLSFLAAMAQEESHIKSVSMNASIEMRFSHGIFLTPPLLGYDNDEYGQLIINEEEAGTVRLIFFMYLYGYSTNDIAQQLTDSGRRTKKGNTAWSASSVHGVLTNERHCGHVKSRKSWTPLFLDHKSVKNRTYSDGTTDKNQYYKRDNHEAIISPDDFTVVQHMLANTKYGRQCFLPQLQVISSGAMHGFVSVNPYWAAFTAEDYIAASESVGASANDAPVQMKAKRGSIDWRGFEVVRAQLFNIAEITSITLSAERIRFSSCCVRKFGGADHVELLVHPKKKQLAVRPCSSEHKNALRWAGPIGGKFYGRGIGAAAYAKTLFTLFGWETEQTYRMRGVKHTTDDETIALFEKGEVLDSFGESYYKHVQKQRIPDAGIPGLIAEYNANPDLNPTAPAALKRQIRQLTEAVNGVA